MVSDDKGGRQQRRLGAARDNDRGLAGGEEEEEERKSNVGRDGRQWWQGGETAVAGVTGNDDVAGWRWPAVGAGEEEGVRREERAVVMCGYCGRRGGEEEGWQQVGGEGMVVAGSGCCRG
ncbi:hypothetical protein GW17_00062118, partial [Ensete ventricosum]